MTQGKNLLRIVLLTTSGAALILISVVLFRTFSVTSQQITIEAVTPASLDMERAAERLAGAIRYKTVSYLDRSKSDPAQFLGFHQYLEQAFPRVHSTLRREVVNEYSLLYTWEGTSEKLKPIILIAHIDVVPAAYGKESDWTYPPFGGHIADGYIWGRGALDVKLAITAPLEAIDILLERQFKPERTVYLAFGHDEEIGGLYGAAKIAGLLKKRGVRAAFTLDEGSVIVNGIVPGVDKPVALVGLAEKGYVTLELTATGEGGHSSKPSHLTAIGKLARAIHRLETKLMPAELRHPAAGIFENLASEMPFGMRVVVANRWLFDSILLSRLEESAATNAIIRTTTAPTLLPQSGTKVNVVPRQAKAMVNFRILPGDTVQYVKDHVQQVIDDPDIKVTQHGESMEPSQVSDSESPEYKALHKTIRQVFPDTVVAPSLVIAHTDSKHYKKIAENSFRFIPMRLGKEDLQRIHGKDERISIENYNEIIQFYIQLLRNTTAG